MPIGFLIDQGHPELVMVLVAVILLLSLFCALLSLFYAGTTRASGRAEPVVVAAEQPRSSPPPRSCNRHPACIGAS